MKLLASETSHVKAWRAQMCSYRPVPLIFGYFIFYNQCAEVDVKEPGFDVSALGRRGGGWDPPRGQASG